MLFAALAAEAVVQICLAVWLVEDSGPLGMALAVVIPQMLTFLFVIPLAIGRILQVDGWRIAGSSLRWGAFGGLTTAIVIWPITLTTEIASLVPLLLVTVGGGMITLAVGYRWVVLPEDQARIVGLVGRAKAQ